MRSRAPASYQAHQPRVSVIAWRASLHRFIRRPWLRVSRTAPCVTAVLHVAPARDEQLACHVTWRSLSPPLTYPLGRVHRVMPTGADDAATTRRASMQRSRATAGSRLWRCPVRAPCCHWPKASAQCAGECRHLAYGYRTPVQDTPVAPTVANSGPIPRSRNSNGKRQAISGDAAVAASASLSGVPSGAAATPRHAAARHAPLPPGLDHSHSNKAVAVDLRSIVVRRCGGSSMSVTSCATSATPAVPPYSMA